MPQPDGYLRRARECYESNHALSLGPPAGATDEEVDQLQAQVGFPLPAAYREFLCWMGRDNRRATGRPLFSHDRVFVEDVAANEGILDDLLRHEGVRHLAAPRMLVWWVHEVYLCYHFPLPAASDDPACYFYLEGDKVLRDAGRFSACLAGLIDGSLQVSDRLAQRVDRRTV